MFKINFKIIAGKNQEIQILKRIEITLNEEENNKPVSWVIYNLATNPQVIQENPIPPQK
jgi:hypothetical protein